MLTGAVFTSIATGSILESKYIRFHNGISEIANFYPQSTPHDTILSFPIPIALNSNTFTGLYMHAEAAGYSVYVVITGYLIQN